MKYLFYKRDDNTYVAEGCIAIKQIMYVEGSSTGKQTHVTLTNNEVLTIDLSIKTVLDVMERRG
jgi:hypothetical protein